MARRSAAELARGGALPVQRMVRAARVERYELGVLVVSIDRLVPVLWEVAHAMEGGQSTRLGGRLVG